MGCLLPSLSADVRSPLLMTSLHSKAIAKPRFDATFIDSRGRCARAYTSLPFTDYAGSNLSLQLWLHRDSV